MEPMGRLDEFIDTATDIRALVTIAVGKSADIEKAVLLTLSYTLSLQGSQSGSCAIDITCYCRWSHRSEGSVAVRTHEMYFSLEDFGGAETIGRWLTTAIDYRTELQRVMATRYKNTMYLEDRVMNVCAPLESFDIARRYRPKNTVDFIDCIKASIDYAGLPFRDLIVERPADWARKVTTARKHLAHHGKQFRADGTVGERLLAEQLYWLFVHCILRVAQAPATAFDRISRHAETLWLIDQSRERLMEP